VLTGAAVLCLLGLTPASADEPDPLDAVAAIAPTVFTDAIVVETDEVTAVDQVDVVVPSDPTDGISLDAQGSGVFSIGLPFADDARLVPDGEHPYFDNGNGSSTVPLVKDDGTVQILTTIDNSDAPSSFSYQLDLPAGATLTLTRNGGAKVVTDNGVVTATIAAPWALDARGRAVETHYAVVGQTLVQVLDFDSDTVFPVVADPKVTSGIISGTSYYNKAETKSIAQAQTTGVIAACIAAGAAGGPIVAAVVGVKCATVVVPMQYTANLAVNSNKCLAMKIYYGTTILTFSTYSGGNCK
jgi:hypothetical protein